MCMMLPSWYIIVLEASPEGIHSDGEMPDAGNGSEPSAVSDLVIASGVCRQWPGG